MKKSKAILLAAVCFVAGFWAGAMVINKYFWGPDVEATHRGAHSFGYWFGYHDAAQGLPYDEDRSRRGSARPAHAQQRPRQ